MNEYFNKNLVMSVEDVKRFQSSTKCWIFNKLFTDEDEKVRDHDRITEKNIEVLLIQTVILILN